MGHSNLTAGIRGEACHKGQHTSETTGIVPIHPSLVLRIIESIPPTDRFCTGYPPMAATTRGGTLHGGYYLTVRLAGTALICIVAAFGAAFLVARAVNHETPARAATPTTKIAPLASVTAHPASHKVNAELVSQFAPLKASLRPRPKPRPKHKAKPKPTVSVAPAAPATTPQTETPTTPVQSAPTVIEPAPSTSSAPTQSSSGGSTTHHKKSGGSSGGSGTTTIGG